MPKRILYLHGISEIGGAEMDLLRLLERIDRNRFEPFVVCPSKGGLIEAIEQLRVPVQPMNFPSWRKLKDMPFIPWAVLRLFRLVRDLKIDVVHVNEYWWGPIGYLASQWAKVPCVVHIRQEIEPRRIKQYWFKKPRRMIAVSNRIRNVAIEAGVDPSRITVVYSGIDPGMASGPDQGRKIREQYKLPAGGPLIGTVANLFPRKGYEYLIEALVEIRTKIPNFYCLIVGDGDETYRAKLFEMVAKQNLDKVVIFAGFQQDIAAHINAMDVFVLPSVMEGLPVALLEAMAMGKPAVATTVGGIPEVIQDRTTGLLVPPRDPHALAQKILYLLENPRTGERLGQAGQASTKRLFSLGGTVSRLQTLYEELTV